MAVSRLMLNLRDPKLHLHGTEFGRGYDQETTINGFGFHCPGDSTWHRTRGIITATGPAESRLQTGPEATSQIGYVSA
jgi:hypothetical protein